MYLELPPSARIHCLSLFKKGILPSFSKFTLSSKPRMPRTVPVRTSADRGKAVASVVLLL